MLAVDRVVAIVNDEAITQHEVDDARRVVLTQMKQQNVQPPAPDVLEKQVLERLITERSLMQFAKETGLRVDDTQIERAIQRIAQDNKLSPEDFKKALAAEKITYAKYRDDIRSELVVQRLREREIESRLTVSDAEVDHYLATVKAQNAGDSEYQLAHILVLVPEQASADQIEARRRRAEEALRQIRSGGEFGQIAAGFSDASDALRGGNLGWRPGARLPTVFAEQVRNMKPGEVSPVLRSASGFHIVKLIDKRGKNDSTIVDQTHARHILIRVNELVSEADGKVEDRTAEGPSRCRCKVRGNRAAQLGGWFGGEGRRSGLAESRRHGRRVSGRDEQARDQSDIRARAFAVWLAHHSGGRAAQAGRHCRTRALRSAAGHTSAQGRRTVPGMGAGNQRSRLC